MTHLHLPALSATQTPDGWTATVDGKPVSAATIGELAAKAAEAHLRDAEERERAWNALPEVAVHRRGGELVKARVLRVTATQIVLASEWDPAQEAGRLKRGHGGDYFEMGSSTNPRFIRAADVPAGLVRA